jgi:hypothetical protein
VRSSQSALSLSPHNRFTQISFFTTPSVFNLFVLRIAEESVFHVVMMTKR